jgi:predicted ArsR family transcriptional regulator
MSLRLLLAGVWMPEGTMRRELLHVEEVTNDALDSVLRESIPSYSPPSGDNEGNGLDGIRTRMARGHRQRVDALLDRIGREKGIPLAREALFKAGLELGKDARERLKIADSEGDLERAAKVLYRVLGIEISMSFAAGEARMRVSRCSLSSHYSEVTCAVLSAADEGMVSGLSPRAEMRFQESITSGKGECLAIIKFQEGRG